MNDQIEDFIKASYSSWEFWEQIIIRGTWGEYDKTQREAERLSDYYEGRFDAGVALRHVFASTVATKEEVKKTEVLGVTVKNLCKALKDIEVMAEDSLHHAPSLAATALNFEIMARGKFSL